MSENEKQLVFMIHEVNRQLGGVHGAIARFDLPGARSLVEHLIERTGRLLDGLKEHDIAEALKGAL